MNRIVEIKDKGIGVPIQCDTLNLDSVRWIDGALSQPTTLDSVQERVGIQPTAKSGIFSTPAQFSLPGQGRPYPDCGEPIIYLCPRCGHLKKNDGEGKNCRRATCPKCYSTWAWLLAKKAASRILHATKVAARQLGRSRRPIHGMISLPRHKWDLFNGIMGVHPATREGYWRRAHTRKGAKGDVKVKSSWIPPKTYMAKDVDARVEAYGLLTMAGIKGALLIPHPWRQKCVLCDGDIVGSWRVDEETKQFTQKERYCEDCDSKEFKWIDGPHFHFIGYGWVEHTTEIELATGYVIKNICVLNNVGGCVWYQLTHAGIKAGRHTITYFGVCALNKYKSPPVPKDTKPELCPVCGAFMLKTTIAALSGKPPPLRSGRSGHYP